MEIEAESGQLVYKSRDEGRKRDVTRLPSALVEKVGCGEESIAMKLSGYRLRHRRFPGARRAVEADEGEGRGVDVILEGGEKRAASVG